MKPNFWKGRRVLVAGCTGFLGSWLVMSLVRLAAQAIVRVADRSARSTFDSNILGAINVLEAVRRVGTVEGTIIASGDNVHGDQFLPCTEDSPMLAQHLVRKCYPDSDTQRNRNEPRLG